MSTISKSIQNGRAIRGRVNDCKIYADPVDLSEPGTGRVNKYMRHVHYRIIHDPCDVKLSRYLLMSRIEVEAMLRAKSFVWGTILESTTGTRYRVVYGKYGAAVLERCDAKEN